MKQSIIKLACLGMLLLACSISTTRTEESTQAPTKTATVQPETYPTPGAPTEQLMTKWDLWSGKETLLRGANIAQGVVNFEIDGPSFKGPGPVGPPHTQADFDRLAALGANYVSISGPGIFCVEPPFEVLPEVVEYYDQVLSMINAADMFATIGFRSGPGRSEWGLCCDGEDWARPYLNDTVWEDREAQAAWSDMWVYMADRYQDNPVVVGYLLMVEPNPAAIHFDIYEAEEFFPDYAGTSFDWNSFYPDIVQAIHAVDEQTPILVGGMNFSSVAWLPFLEPVDAAGIVYVVDQYAPFTYTHQDKGAGFTYPGSFDTNYDGQADDFGSEWLENLFGTLDSFRESNNVPITIDEYGLVRWTPHGAAFLDDQMALFEARGMNYAIWEWASSWEEYNQEVNAFNFRFGPDPANTLDVPNDLQDTLIRYWALNTLRPSNVKWSEK